MPHPKTSAWLIPSFLCAVALAFAWPIVAEPGNWGILDWDFQLYHHGVPRATIVEYGELPLWNPFNRSGVPMLAHPESRVLTPTFLLTLAFGEVVGLKLEVVLHLMVGMLGVYALLRSHALERTGAAAGAIVFGCSSFFALHVTVGHVWSLSFAWLPWLLLATDRALLDLRYSLAVSGLLTLIFFSGAPYPFMISGLLIALYTAVRAVEMRAWKPHAALLALVAAQTLTLAAVKLWPTVELMSAYPRTTAAESGYSIAALGNALFDPHQTLDAARAERPAEFNGTPLHEGMYVGAVAALLFALGAFHEARKRAGWLVLGLLFAWIALGQHAPIDLWSLLHRLPGFDNMRMVQRFGVVTLLFFAAFAGLGAAHLARFHRSLPWLAIALLLVELFLVNHPVQRDAFSIPPPALERRSAFVQAAGLPYYDAQGFIRGRARAGRIALSSVYPAFLSLQGSVRGYQIVPFASHATPIESPAYRGEAFFASGESARIEHWSPTRLEIAFDPAREGSRVLIVNQNHDSGWQATARGEPRPVRAEDGLIAVEVGPGDDAIALGYRPASVVRGAWVSGIAIVAWSGFWLGASRARRSDPERPTAS